MDASTEVNVRNASYSELEELYDLIKLSRAGRAVVSLEELKAAAFEVHQPDSLHLTQADPALEFDLNSMRTDKPVAEALVAEVNGHLVGYIISHHHYSPWTGHGINVDEIYVKRNQPMKELIERKLIGNVIASAKLKNIKTLFFDSDKVEFNFMRDECKWYRNDKDSDWSLLRISQ